MNQLISDEEQDFEVPVKAVAGEQRLVDLLGSIPPTEGDTLHALLRDLTTRAYYGYSTNSVADRIEKGIRDLTGCSVEEVDDIFQDLVALS